MTQTRSPIDPPVEIEVPAETRPSGASDAGDPLFAPSDTFIHRHIGPDEREIREMLEVVGCDSLDALCNATIPASIRVEKPLDLGRPRGEAELIDELHAVARRNMVHRSFIGQGYYGTITPPVIQRNILESPGWYTQYTPYQAEIAQGRLEALLNFQTMVADLTGLPLANASLLDEATAAAEAMIMCLRIKGDDKAFFVARDCHPQTINVVKTRARSLGVDVVVGDPGDAIDWSRSYAGVLLQYPTTDGRIEEYADVANRAHEHGALVVAATDLLALTLITPPGEWGADIAVGSSQRFGVPMGFGGPHAAFLATTGDYVRKMPGRIIGVSKDAQGNPALRMAIQTREQHIKRDRATSNICTAQVLLAIMASMYAVYHGPQGLNRIARRVHALTQAVRVGLRRLGHEINDEDLVFDTLRIRPIGMSADEIHERARAREINLREYGDGTVGVALDESTTPRDVEAILAVFSNAEDARRATEGLFDDVEALDVDLPAPFRRTSDFLSHPVFNTHHSETEMLRYIKKLESRDLSLAQSMIPLGSCTMKLNGTSEMLPVSWPEFANLHPYAPAEQTRGYQHLFDTLEAWLCEITGFAACSLQPNAGSQGEYAGLLAIRGYHGACGEAARVDCLIPTSAHGTNPASAVCAGMNVVSVNCDENGNIDIEDLRKKASERRDTLAAIMITYPSTHGVFEESIREICEIVHENGGLVYLDGANMNAQVGLTRPGDYGADVCHLNLHKTFCIPHGGGGPGMGPICATEALRPFLPTDPLAEDGDGVGPIAAAAYGSPSILPISWVYIALMGERGLRLASQVSILNANYMAKRLEGHYDVLYKGRSGTVAHEFIIDCRAFDKAAGVRIDDIAKRLMDYGFHAPTMAWPVPGTLMIEPTESESKAELDRFCDALIGIREEIRAIEKGQADREDNVLKGSPHTIQAVSADEWTHPYSREQAGYPAAWLREHKFWPAVGRIDNPYGDRNLVCTCPTVGEFAG